MTSAPIIVLGAPRSGTTWLAKILDSHPGVLYRHEPDEVLPPLPLPATDAALRGHLACLLAERSLRSAGKRPFFRKAGQSEIAFRARTALAYALHAAGRFMPALARLPLPDLADTARLRPALKSVRWCETIGPLARAVPEARILLILRHPCGQVESVMRGNAARHFDLREDGTDMPFHEARAIARSGLSDADFQALPAAAKYAWDWAAFNAAALEGLADAPNARTVLYEDLCADPMNVARGLLAFAGLDRAAQTEAFIARSATSEAGQDDYYGVFRNAGLAAWRWRERMPQADQDAVMDVARRVQLAALWAET